MPEHFPALRVQRVTRAKILLALGAFAALAACQRAAEAPPPEMRPVRATTIGKGESGGRWSLTGTVQAQNEINLSFRIDGRLIERTVDIGDNVKPGQLIARLDPQNEESGLQSVRAQIAGANARLLEARNNYDRMRDLVVDAAVSRAQYDQAEALLQSAESQVDALQAPAQPGAEPPRLHAPRSPTLPAWSRRAGRKPGEMVSPGRMIIQVAREGARDAVFDVPARIKDNAPRNADITVALSSDPEGARPAGRVREVSPRADPVTGTFAVRVRLIDPPPAMRLGSTVTGRMQLDAAAGITIPGGRAGARRRQDGGVGRRCQDRHRRRCATSRCGASDSATVQVASGLNAG